MKLNSLHFGLAASVGILSLCVSTSAWSWGNVGHQTVALVAEKNLDKNARANLAVILGVTNPGSGSNEMADAMTEAALWPDKIKRSSSWRHTSAYHYTGVSDGDSYAQMLDDQKSPAVRSGDIVRAIVKAEDILRDPNSRVEEKSWALKFMIHFVGDLHQPLHTGRPEDRGGNAIKMSWFGASSNLHSIWDSGLIMHDLNEPGAPPNEITAFLEQIANDTSGSSTSIATSKDAQDLIVKLPTFSAGETAKLNSSYILDWMNESMQVRLDAYQSQGLNSTDYYTKNILAARKRIAQAGIRLAGLLNAIFSGQEMGTNGQSKSLRNLLTQKLGASSSDEIMLDPNDPAFSFSTGPRAYEFDLCTIN